MIDIKFRNSVTKENIVEYFLIAIVIFFNVKAALFLFNAGYLPYPFYYHTDDTFMDWFNPSYWSNNSGIYDVYESTYPPFSYIFLNVFSIHSCYYFDAAAGRDCDWLGKAALVGFYMLNIFLIFQIYRKHNLKAYTQRSIAMSFGFPMLFALDRGNLIIPCFTAFMLSHGRILKSSWFKWIAMACSINFKPYLIVTILPNIIKRRWRAWEGSILVGFIVYLISFAILGTGSPFELIHNIIEFDQKTIADYINNSQAATSYSSLLGLINSDIPIMPILGSRLIELSSNIMLIALKIDQVGILLVVFLASLMPRKISYFRLMALMVGGLISTVEVGVYAEVFFIFLVFFERGRGVLIRLALLISYVAMIPADIIIAKIAHEVLDGYLTNRTVGIDIALTVGDIVRPGLILSIQYLLIISSLLEMIKGYFSREIRVVRNFEALATERL